MSSLFFLLSASVRITLLIGYAKERTTEGGNGRSRTRCAFGWKARIGPRVKTQSMTLLRWKRECEGVVGEWLF